MDAKVQLDSSIVQRCGSCGRPMGGLAFCEHCRAIQPFPDSIDYFSVFGLDRKMQIDLEDLERRFHDLSRRFHPDLHQNKADAEREISLANSAVINKAYRTLRDPISRTEYLVRLVDGNQEIALKPPADLFEEILELQESLEEFKRTPDGMEKEKESLRKKLKSIGSELRARDRDQMERLQKIFVQWDALAWDDREAERRLAGEMKEFLSHRSYLGRVLDDIQQVLGGKG